MTAETRCATMLSRDKLFSEFKNSFRLGMDYLKAATVSVVFYAVVFLLYTIVVGVQLVHSVTTRGKELLTVVTDSMVSTSGIIAISLFVFALVILILEVIYGIGVYKFRRWVLPLVLTFSFSTLLIGILNLFNLNFAGITNLVGLLIGMTFMCVVGYTSIKFLFS